MPFPIIRDPHSLAIPIPASTVYNKNFILENSTGQAAPVERNS